MLVMDGCLHLVLLVLPEDKPLFNIDPQDGWRTWATYLSQLSEHHR